MSSFSTIKSNTDVVLRYKTSNEARIQPPEVGSLIKDLCDTTQESLPKVKTTQINYVPTATGNATDLGRFVKSAVNGRRYYIDLEGNAFDIDAVSSGSSGRKPLEILTDAGATTTFTHQIPIDLMAIERGGQRRYKDLDWVQLSLYTVQWVIPLDDGGEVIAMEYD